MKKTLSMITAALIIAAFFASCAGAPPAKTEAPPQVKSSGFGIDAINDQIKGFSVDGFPGASANIKSSKDLENMKKIVGIIKPIIDSLPDGYAMQITGHCANFDSKAKQKSVSTARAKRVYDELKKAGVDSKKMTYRGAGVDEPSPAYGDKDFKQRRVSFKAIQK